MGELKVVNFGVPITTLYERAYDRLKSDQHREDLTDLMRVCQDCHTHKICRHLSYGGKPAKWLCDDCLEDFRRLLERKVRYRVSQSEYLKRRYPHYSDPRFNDLRDVVRTEVGTYD